VFRDSGWTQIRPLLLFGGKLFLMAAIFDDKNSRPLIEGPVPGVANS
jgi:hypothetical protein